MRLIIELKKFWETSYNWYVLAYTLIAFWMKNGYIHIERTISAAHMLGAMLPSEKIQKKCAIWFVLVYILIKFRIHIFFKWFLCIEQYDIFWWTFQAIFPMNKQKYRAILCVVVYILIESCV